MLLIGVPIGILLIGAFSYSINTSKYHQSKIFMFFCFAFVVLFVGLRSRYVGSPDTNTYATLFENINGDSLGEFLSRSDITWQNFLYSEGTFYLVTWILAQIFDGAQIFILITTAIINYGVASFIWKNTKGDTMPWILYVCLGSLTFSMNGMRQAIAMSVCLFAFEFAKQKNLLKFLLVVLLAFTFHRTAVVFLIVYPICNYRSSVFTNAIVGIGLVAFLLNATRIASLYDSIAGKEYAFADNIEGGGFVTVLVYIIAIVLSLLYLKISEDDQKKIINSLVVLCFCGLLFYIARYFSSQIYERVSYYFFYFVILLFPKLEGIFDIKSRFFYRCIVMLMAILLFAYRVSSGSFANFQLLS